MRVSFLFVFIFLQTTNAQDFIITGKVFSEGQPLTSASVTVKGTNSGVTTDSEGQFSIFISNIANPKLLISYLGHKSQIKTINPETTDLGIIELEWDNKLEEGGFGNPKTHIQTRQSVPVEVYGQLSLEPTPPLRFLKRWKM